MKNNQKSADSQDDNIKYIPYAKALLLLKDRLNATAYELAMWIWMGQDTGDRVVPEFTGIAAYLIDDVKNQPERFYFTDTGNDADYLSPLQLCSFKSDDIAKFQPEERYITYESLIKRWEEFKDIGLEAFIHTKVTEEKLYPYNPITGLTSEYSDNEGLLPSFKNALFAVTSIEEIETEELSIVHSRDAELQQNANDLAMQWKEDGRRSFTKREIASELAISEKWNFMTAYRIERILRKQW